MMWWQDSWGVWKGPYQKWYEEALPMNQWKEHGHLSDTHAEQRLARLVQSHQRATVEQAVGKGHAGYDKHTLHYFDIFISYGAA